MKKKDIIHEIKSLLAIPDKDATRIYDKAKSGGEFLNISEAEDWFEYRLKPNVVWIDETGYEKMCIDALKILKSAAATDYGSSRQRDLGQMWGDMTRGYLAEYAVCLYLEKIWNIVAELGHEQGDMADYLPSDIHHIQHPDEESKRPPNLKIGIKGTKWNGIWLDIPGGQFAHSDVHIMVKVGVDRDHLFAYFKHISVFRDKVLKKGIESGSLDSTLVDELFNALPDFVPIPAYIAGFAPANATYQPLPYTGKMGHKHFTVTGWNGEILPHDLDKIKEQEGVPSDGKVKFEGIGEFSHSKGYLFNTGNLLWKPDDWQKYIINHI